VTGNSVGTSSTDVVGTGVEFGLTGLVRRGILVVVVSVTTGLGGKSSSEAVPTHSIYDARHSRRVHS
jgi:hypothetical protein